jgi:TonB-linked SusC/RagA family outer membrane protein
MLQHPPSESSQDKLKEEGVYLLLNPKTEFMPKREILACFLKKPLGREKILRIMKITTLSILVLFLHLSVFANGQDRITVVVRNTVWSKALVAVEKASNYRFVYSSDIAPVNKKIDLVVRDADLPEVMDKLLASTTLSYKVMPDQLVVLFSKVAAAPEVRVTGRITDENGNPLAGASIRVKGTNLGVSANANGEYAITVPDDAVLVVSYVGYDERQIPVSGQTTINIALQPSAKIQDQVVVIGYGTATKRDLTGSIVKISGRDVGDKPNTNPVASLQGKVAGLSVVNSGQPGQEPDIRIRGTISRYQTKPLYVVDGIFNDNINFINPADIESMEILKDPSSLAIFGVRGANGVIIITTKRGKTGAPSINFTTTTGIKRIVDKPELTDAAGFKTLYDEQRVNQGASPYPYYNLFQGNTNWIEQIQNNNAIVSNNNLSLSSGTDRNKFYMGIGYNYEEGLIKHERLERMILSVSDELKVGKAVKVGFNINGYRGKLPQLRSFVSSLIATPIVEPFNSTYGVYNKLPEEIGGPQIGNPLMGVEATKNTALPREYRAVGSIFAEVSFLKNFTAKATFYGDLGFNDGRNYTPLINVYAAEINQVAAQGGFTRTSVSQYRNTSSKFQQDYVLTYKGKWGDHSLTAIGGFTTYYEGFESISGNVLQYTGRDPIPYDKRWWYLGVFPYGDPTSRTSNSEQWDRTTVSYLFRALYNYRGKYMLNASFRRDGSSEISPSERFKNFYAVGAAWEVSKEGFMADQNIFDYLKVKASWGILGNQYNGIHYPYYPNYQVGPTAIFGENVLPAYVLAYRNDPNLKWESVTSVEGGFEAAVLQNRLRFEANYYNKLTNDLLTFVNTGSEQFYVNSGKIRNKGFEGSATWSDKTKSGFGYSIGGNITTLNNEVEEVFTDGFTIIEGSSRTIAGYPIGHFFGYVHDGIYQSYADKLGSPVASALGNYGPGDIKFKDQNGDNKIDVNDRTLIGNPTPDFIYGINLSANYKGFDVGIDFQGVYGNEIFREWGNGNSFAQFNYRQARLGRWSGDGTSNWEPQVSDLAAINRENSTYMIEDGSYFRLRNLQIGYTFNATALAKAHIKSLRIFFNGQNLKTWKHNSGFTPEAGGSAIRFGVDNGGYPIPAITSLGLNVTF